MKHMIERMQYQYMTANGMEFPNSLEGDLLKTCYEIFLETEPKNTHLVSTDKYEAGYLIPCEECGNCGTLISSDWKCCPMCEHHIIRDIRTNVEGSYDCPWCDGILKDTTSNELGVRCTECSYPVAEGWHHE